MQRRDREKEAKEEWKQVCMMRREKCPFDGNTLVRRRKQRKKRGEWGNWDRDGKGKDSGLYCCDRSNRA
jgi:hypothetical protein